MSGTRPYVCGAIGTWEQSRLDRMLAEQPVVSSVHVSGLATLWSSSPVSAWKAGPRNGWLWWPLADGSTPGSWQQAAEQRMSAGLVVDHEMAVLHTCALGMQELYTRVVGGAVYFSTRIGPLLAVDESPLHSDWAAWAAVLTVGGPVAGATPFEEIRRPEAATGWQADARGVRTVSFAPSWLTTEPTGCEPEELLDVVRAHMPDSRGLRRTAVTLSGGWDSRLLGALASQQSRRSVLAWTTSPDDGYDRDIELSRPVAAAFGMKHNVLVQDLDAWRRERTAVYERVQHQTPLHAWLMPLARAVHNRREPLLDGLAGDILLRGYDERDGVLAATPGTAQREAIWSLVADGGPVSDWFAPKVAERLADASRSAFAAATSGFDGHPAAVTLAWLMTRTARAIALSPMCLFAPEVDIRLPFVHPDVIAAALRIPVAHLADGQYYRKLLSAAAGSAGTLPSTNDPAPSAVSSRRRQTEPTALAEMTAQIAADDVVSDLLGPYLRSTLTDPGERERILAFNGPRSVMQWASMLAHWRATYADRLAS